MLYIIYITQARKAYQRSGSTTGSLTDIPEDFWWLGSTGFIFSRNSLKKDNRITIYGI